MINLINPNIYQREFNAIKKKESLVLREMKKSLKRHQTETRVKYYSHYKNVLAYVQKVVGYDLKHQNIKRYEFMSASINYLLPEVPESLHFEYYFGLEKWRNLTFDHSKSPSMLKSVGNFSQDNEQIKSDVSTLYVTYKYGLNQAVIGYLVANNMKLVLLIDSNAYESKEVFSKLIDGVKESFNCDQPYEIINVEDPKAVLKLASLIRKGYSALAFLDGNTGSGGQYAENVSMTKVRFLNGSLRVRQGIAKLGLMLKIPIVPIINSIDEEVQKPRFDIYGPIVFDKEKDSVVQVKVAIQGLWDILEDNIKTNPYQWDGWDRVHRFFDFEKEMEINSVISAYPKNAKYGFNRSTHRVFKMGKSFFLLNRSNFETFEIEAPLYHVFHKGNNLSIKKLLNKGIEESLLGELITYNILIIKQKSRSWKNILHQ